MVYSRIYHVGRDYTSRIQAISSPEECNARHLSRSIKGQLQAEEHQ